MWRSQENSGMSPRRGRRRRVSSTPGSFDQGQAKKAVRKPGKPRKLKDAGPGGMNHHWRVMRAFHQPVS